VGGSQPTLVANALNGQPVLQYDGVNDFLTFGLNVNGLSGMTLCLVSANTADRTGGSTEAENAALFWNQTQGWGCVYLSPFQQRVQMRFGTTQTYNWPTYVRSSSLAAAYSRTIAVKNGTTDALYVNGSLVVQESGKMASVAGCQTTGNLGRGYDNNTFFAGRIAEVLVYRRALSDSERQRLNAYLGSKYFGSAAATESSASPVISSGTLNLERVANGLLRCVATGEPGQAYEVLGSTDMIHWESLATKNASSAGDFDFSVDPETGWKFFKTRLVSSPN